MSTGRANRAILKKGPPARREPSSEAQLERPEDLDAEFAELSREHAGLEAARHELENRPKDIVAHKAHVNSLRAYLEHLHRYMTARGLRVPRSTRR